MTQSGLLQNKKHYQTNQVNYFSLMHHDILQNTSKPVIHNILRSSCWASHTLNLQLFRMLTVPKDGSPAVTQLPVRPSGRLTQARLLSLPRKETGIPPQSCPSTVDFIRAPLRTVL